MMSVEFDRIQLETSVTLPELTSLPSPSLSGTQQFLRPLVAYGPGLACFMSPETVVLFQANDDSKDYKQMGLVKVPPGSLQDSDGKNKSQIVVSMCVSLSGDSLVIATDQKQLYILHLTPQGGEIGMEPIAVTGHVGPVSGLAVCARCPIVASCSLDGSVHVWSYKTRLLETSIVFAEQCLSLALHPSALFFAAGFSDKLRYFSILVDGPRCSRQLPVCACHEVVFSHGGHLLSAASENVVHVFCCVTFNCLIRLHGHTGKVSGLDWRQDDQRLGTVSLDGVIFLWNLWQKSEDGASLQASEAEFKGFCFHSLSVGPVGTQYAVGEVASEAVNVKNKVARSLQPSGVIVEVVDSQEQMVVDLRKQLEEVLSQHSEQLQMRETMCGQQKRKITEHFLHEIKNLNRQCQILKMEKEQQQQKFEEEMADIVDKHIKEVQKLESIHEQRSLKTHGEAERARKELAPVHELCTSLFAEAQKKAQQELEAVKQHFQKELQLNIIQHTKEQEILQQRLQEQEEIPRLAEEDVDMEILEIKLNMELQLKNKQECNIQFKSERDLMRMKCAQMQQHADEQAFNVEQQGMELQHLQGIKETHEQIIRRATVFQARINRVAHAFTRATA
uniref:WD repeat domain 65 n=1 Tax=Eptatretus burgeri TaxID=7764 RepID=A0A8C4X1M1_EPTBU